MNYLNYSSIDFAADDYFKQWILQPNQENTTFWESWLKDNPGKTKEIEEAKKIIHLINFNQYYPSTQKYSEDWKKLNDHLATYDRDESENVAGQEENEAGKQTKLKPLIWWSSAAILIGFLLFSALLFNSLFFSGTKRMATSFGETKTYILPDRSEVTLNSNSSILFSKEWDSNSPREVWLQGEGFFSVTHKTNNQAFIVHVNRLKIEVLGTEFNVNNRRGTTKVVLNKGKVKVNTTESPELFMNPGELISFSETDKTLKKSSVNPAIYSSWKNNILMFSDTPLYEIAELLEDNYGLEIIFENRFLRNKRFTGTIPSKNVDVLIESIAESFHLELIRDNNRVKFKAREK